MLGVRTQIAHVVRDLGTMVTVSYLKTHNNKPSRVEEDGASGVTSFLSQANVAPQANFRADYGAFPLLLLLLAVSRKLAVRQEDDQSG